MHQIPLSTSNALLRPKGKLTTISICLFSYRVHSWWGEKHSLRFESQCLTFLLIFRLVFDGSAYEFECDICETAVSSTSKHCGSCNRCVEGFDHHCRWLNNCVGKKNYLLFFRLIICVFFMCLVHNVTNGFVLYYLATASASTIESHESTY